MDQVDLRKPYSFKFFKSCLPQILFGLFLNTLSHIIMLVIYCYLEKECYKVLKFHVNNALSFKASKLIKHWGT